MLEIIKKDLGKYKEFSLVKRFAFKDYGIEMKYNESKEEFYKRILDLVEFYNREDLDFYVTK